MPCAHARNCKPTWDGLMTKVKSAQPSDVIKEKEKDFKYSWGEEEVGEVGWEDKVQPLNVFLTFCLMLRSMFWLVQKKMRCQNGRQNCAHLSSCLHSVNVMVERDGAEVRDSPLSCVIWV